MRLSVLRDDKDEGRVFGKCYIDGAYFCETLENAAKAIVAGGPWGLSMTLSGRAIKGTLWSPDITPETRHFLPEIVGVPGRTAIRVHAANWPEQLEGCVATGTSRVSRDGSPGSAGVSGSRDRLSALIRLILGAKANGETVEITVGDA